MDRRLPTALISVALIVAACGGGEAGDTTTSEVAEPTTQAPATTSAQPTTTAAADETTIDIRSFRFSGVQEVQVGTTVTVTNFDEFTHTWTADGGLFDSGSLREGESFDFTFDEPGEYSFFCSIHPNQMTGTITVTG